MREHLLGYLLGALDGPEHEQVQRHLEQDQKLRQECESLDAHVELLRCDCLEHDPPDGLATRTCQFVGAYCQQATKAPREQVPRELGGMPLTGRWTMADMVVAAGIFLAASLLFWPAIAQSNRQAESAACQYNLKQLGFSLQRYADNHEGYYPRIPLASKLSAVGLVGPILRDDNLLEDPNWLLCPSSELKRQRANFQIPTCEELENCEGSQLAKLKQTMGGSYAFNLGYTDRGVYRTTRNLGRTHFAVISDAPGDGPQRQSSVHGRWGQNVLFDDFHVQYIRGCMIEACGDEFFVNRNGLVEAGLDSDDSVLAGSSTPPMIRPMSAPIKP